MMGFRFVALLGLSLTSAPAFGQGIVYNAANAPDAPTLAEMDWTDSISQYGITWTFSDPVPVGQFLTGDYYIVGPATITSVSPAPTGSGSSFRNGSMLNPSVDTGAAYDGRHLNATWALNRAAQFPLEINPGDSLVSSISLSGPAANEIIVHSSSPTETTPLRSLAVLTSLAAPVPVDTFRPGYADLQKDTLHRASDIATPYWNNLPRLAPTAGANSSLFQFDYLERAFERPWIDHVYGWGSRDMHAVENMPGYGREVARIVSLGALKLMTDATPEEKATLMYHMMQVGIDNWAIAQRGTASQPAGWPAQGGFGNGRKFPIVLAAVMLQDEQMLNLSETAPYAMFDEDLHTAWGESWTGADVVFTGHSSPPPYPERGPYEHLHPSQWLSSSSESYRRCCTSTSWVGEALATMMLGAEDVWDHDPFFAYVDRWMTEDDSQFVQEILAAGMGNFTASWARQGQTWEPIVNSMWAAYRNNLPPPIPEPAAATIVAGLGMMLLRRSRPG
ncbi:MAG: hypothetical protein WD009_02930 [Phycisphaeraceae bacterium]